MNDIRLTLVGDIFPANLDITVGFGISNEFAKHNGEVWLEPIRKIVKESDIIFGNLEAPLIYDSNIAANSSFAGSFKFAEFLKNCKFNVLSVANNHILELGEKGFLDTIDILKKANIKPVGFHEDGNSNLVLLEKDNVKFGFVGYNSVHDIVNPSLYSDFDIGKAIASLGKMKDLGVDCKIVSLHWGRHEEYINIPSAENIKIARLLVDHGADIIVGHHPHVVQPTERYKGKLILYSLGNFLFDMIWSSNVRIGLAVNVSYSKKKKEFDYELAPVYINSNYTPAFYDKTMFNIKMRKITNQFSLFDKDEALYIKRRNYQIKLNQYYQRIMMKIFLVKNWNKLSSQGKKKYFEKINNRVFKR